MSPSASPAPARALPTPKPDLAATRKPQSPLAVFWWRRRVWFESTFVFSLLEPWEKVLLLTILFATVILVVTGVYKYLPQHLFLVRRRAMYYLWGQEGDERLLWQWLGFDVDTPPLGIYKEL